MCNCLRHKWVSLPPEFCQMWEKMEKVQTTKNKELTDLKYKNGEIIKAYKQYRAEYKTITAKWQEIYEPMWEQFDEQFNADLRG